MKKMCSQLTNYKQCQGNISLIGSQEYLENATGSNQLILRMEVSTEISRI